MDEDKFFQIYSHAVKTALGDQLWDIGYVGSNRYIAESVHYALCQIGKELGISQKKIDELWQKSLEER